MRSPGLNTNIGSKLDEREVKLIDNMTMDNIEYQKRVMQRFVNEQKRMKSENTEQNSNNDNARFTRESKICTKQPYQVAPKPSIKSSVSSEIDGVDKDHKDHFSTENWFKIETKSIKGEQTKSNEE